MGNLGPKRIIVLSGGFDPPTHGQVAMIHDASRVGEVIILLNSDSWCAKARNIGNKPFLSFDKRKLILEALPYVHRVVPANDTDGTVTGDLRALVPDFFGNGGSRTPANTPEVEVCKELGIGLLWFLGSVIEPTIEEALGHAIRVAKVY